MTGVLIRRGEDTDTQVRQPCGNDEGRGEVLQLLDGECQGLVASPALGRGPEGRFPADGTGPVAL